MAEDYEWPDEFGRGAHYLMNDREGKPWSASTATCPSSETAGSAGYFVAPGTSTATDRVVLSGTIHPGKKEAS